jgi:hypothetical protein
MAFLPRTQMLAIAVTPAVLGVFGVTRRANPSDIPLG